MGDPAGIGPEIVVKALARPALRRGALLAAVGDPSVMERAARHARVAIRFSLQSPEEFDPAALARSAARGTVPLVASTQGAWGRFEPRVPSAESGEAAARAIETAARLAQDGRGDAVVTAPISKTALRAASYPYPGHTEFLGALAGGAETRMLFVGGPFRILLATVHLPLRRVP